MQILQIRNKCPIEKEELAKIRSFFSQGVSLSEKPIFFLFLLSQFTFVFSASFLSSLDWYRNLGTLENRLERESLRQTNINAPTLPRLHFVFTLRWLLSSELREHRECGVVHGVHDAVSGLFKVLTQASPAGNTVTFNGVCGFPSNFSPVSSLSFSLPSLSLCRFVRQPRPRPVASCSPTSSLFHYMSHFTRLFLFFYSRLHELNEIPRD